MRPVLWGVLGLVLVAPPIAMGAGVRSHTRPTETTGTAVTESQANELTLTLTDVAVRPIQTWVRTSARLDAAGRLATAFVREPDAALIKVGQRLRCFSPATRSQMHQGKVVSVERQGDGVIVRAALADELPNDGSRYVVEIVADQGDFLSVPNASIIEEENRHVVYVRQAAGGYLARDVQTGIQGELYTVISGGVAAGDQVVSIGSFFIDAENKLKSKSAGMGSMPGMDHNSMPGMNHGAAGSAKP